ncbi:siderophore-interacting protein [Acinetobacter boissieri]|uniref:NADPH-dependent ferric siderophore reductase, contains FAD-binding and SIP domains n=1 Tax=Acinetobacter boissieri TaxID=1219383 RepID=A0A1G6HJR2_9GAMM|nr:siderophore-interacting protein [Acinetobacter boissieri]SDB94155.1 NADPH-dependent ferric siderophore reductase, contains FAD-binding and SIP domains [Acinetobacter boissieri]
MKNKTSHHGFGRGGLRWVVLSLIQHKPQHGYDLLKTIQHMTQGTYTPSAGVLYPLLNDLVEKKLIYSEPDAHDGRKRSYHITALGQQIALAYQPEVEELLKKIQRRSQQPAVLLEKLDQVKQDMRQLLTQQELTHADAELLANSLEQTRKTIQLIQRSQLMQNPPAINSDEKKPYRVKHQLKIRWVEVQQKIHLSPNLVRIIFYGEDLADFQSLGFDDHVKLFFPDPNTGEIHLPNFNQTTQQPTDLPKISRDYTPRSFDVQQKTLCIDFVLHDAGPATDWAKHAECGQRLVIGGPRGSMIIPQSYAQHVFIGDETALPAIARRLEELSKNTKALAFIFVDNASTEIKLTHSIHSQIFWLHRHQQNALTEYLWSNIDWTQKDSFFWIACEAEQSRQLKHTLIEQYQIDSAQIKAAGYWQRKDPTSKN